MENFRLTIVVYIRYIGYMEHESAQLAEWEQALNDELRELSRRRESLDADIQRISKKIELIRQIRSLGDSLASSSATPVLPPTPEVRATPIVVRDAVKKILSDSGRPLHIGEIHRDFLTRGLPIPGRGTAFNILAHLVNDKAFVRVARGTYALAGSVPEEQILPKAPRKKRSRRRAKRAREEES